MQCDSGPSFPASPLIQDDGLLRRDFARRGFLPRGGATRKILPLIPLMTLIYTDLMGTGRTRAAPMGEKFVGFWDPSGFPSTALGISPEKSRP